MDFGTVAFVIKKKKNRKKVDVFLIISSKRPRDSKQKKNTSISPPKNAPKYIHFFE